MKGIVFTEFLDFVSDHWGMDTADDIIEDCVLPSGGAYTSVGTYDHAEMAALTGALAARSSIAPDDLMRRFGRHLGLRFAALYPTFFSEQASLFGFLDSVDEHIHVEVRKLYADAQLPAIRTRLRASRLMIMEYRSDRHLEALAEGLILGAADYYEEDVTVASRALHDGGGAFIELTIGRAT